MWPRRRREEPGPYLFDEHFPHDAIPAGEPVEPFEIVGIADHDRDALYEFTIPDGSLVTLGYLDCTGIDVRLLDRTLTLAFTHSSGPNPVLSMHFEGARVLRWRLETPLAPTKYTGQVSDLWWDNRHTFALYLTNDEIAFTASRLTVTTDNLPDLH